jgi:alcohol dehydrogenase, propanol-preferring
LSEKYNNFLLSIWLCLFSLRNAKITFMHAMILNRLVDLSHTSTPLEPTEFPMPAPGDDEILIRVTACGVCHTELDEIEGRTPPPQLPVIPGHQVVGKVVGAGARATHFGAGDRVGVAWIYWACGQCGHCRRGNENLCPQFKATGRDRHGGYAQYMAVDQRFAHRIPDTLTDAQAAPLLCAGAVGFRSLRLTGLCNGQRLGLTGFGASAHLVLMLVRHRFPDSAVYVFARSPRERQFALQLGAAWAGDTMASPPRKLHAIIDTTPVWKPVVAALEHLTPGGRLVINAIRKESKDREELLRIDYARHLWMEKEIKSVANVARQDVAEFLELAGRIPITPEVRTYALNEANRALMELKQGGIRGSKVLVIDQ